MQHSQSRIVRTLALTCALVICLFASFGRIAYAEVVHGCDFSRTEGINATDTAAKCALGAFKRSETVVVVSTAAPAEALVGLSVAGSLDCALLESDPVILTDSVTLALRSLGAKNVILCGTPESLTAPIEDGIRSQGLKVERLGGATAAEISLSAFQKIRATKPSSPALAVVSAADATGAVSLGAWAYQSVSPVLVTTEAGLLTDAQVAAIHADPGISRVIVSGPTSIIDGAVYDQIGAIYHITRLDVADARRSAAVSALWTADWGLAWTEPVVASVASPTDGIAAGLLAGKQGVVLEVVGNTDDAIALSRAYGAQPKKATLVGTAATLAPATGSVSFTFDLSPKESAIVTAAKDTPFPGPSLCAQWVSDVYAAGGFARPYGDARDMYAAFCSSSDVYGLRPGMIIGVPRHPHTEAGSIYGHVAIYMGFGMVRQSGTEVVRELSLAEWIAHYGETVIPGWGFAG